MIEFPSPFNEDHFISENEVIKMDKYENSFRPLLTRIISYRI